MTSNSDNPAIPRMVHALGYLSYALETSCAPCWALTGRLYPADHPAFSAKRCKTDTIVQHGSFENLCPSFSQAAGCENCWIPRVESYPNFPYSNHSVARKCVHPNAFKQIIWVVYQTPLLWEAFSRELRRIHLGEEGWFSERDPNIGNTSSIMTVNTYVQWLCQERDGMLNVGHLVYWLLHRNGSLGKSVRVYYILPIVKLMVIIISEISIHSLLSEDSPNSFFVGALKLKIASSTNISIFLIG